MVLEVMEALVEAGLLGGDDVEDFIQFAVHAIETFVDGFDVLADLDYVFLESLDFGFDNIGLSYFGFVWHGAI